MVFEIFTAMISSFGYLGIFLVSLLSNASLFIPIPGWIFIAPAGLYLNPWLVGIVAGLGAAIGELVSYYAGVAGEKIYLSKQKGKKKTYVQTWLNKVEFWFKKHGGFAIIFTFACTPLPDDIVGIFCGAVKYDVKKFFLAQFLGKTVLSLVIVFAGLYGIEWFLGVFGVSI